MATCVPKTVVQAVPNVEGILLAVITIIAPAHLGLPLSSAVTSNTRSQKNNVC